MARSDSFKAYRVAQDILDRLEKRMTEERFRGSMTAYIEGILDRYADGLFESSTEPKMVHATRVRRGTSGEQRKIA